MKKILLFAGHNTSRRGGMSDFVDSFDSIYEAKQFMESEKTQLELLDTLPSIQWAQIYDSEENLIVINGKVEIWEKDDVGNVDDEETSFKWMPVDNRQVQQPLLIEASYEKEAQAAAEAEKAKKEAVQQQAQENAEDSLKDMTTRVIGFDLGAIDSVVDEVVVNLEFAFNLVAMQQEGEVTDRHVRVLSIYFSPEDKNYLESLGGNGAPAHWIKKAQEHFTDEKMMDFFNNEVLTEDELNEIQQSLV